jgi:cellulose synthase (UDP-forming)
VFGILLLGVVATVVRIWAEPYKADVTLVTGGWNLLNLIIAGCALGVVSERATRRQTHRVVVDRPCRFLMGDKIVEGIVRDVSVGGASIRLSQSALPGLKRGAFGTLEFTPLSDLPVNQLPMEVRKMTVDDNGIVVGCRFLTETPEHHRLIADLAFANADQWSSFQKRRHQDIGILRGTLWFLTVSLYQTGRGLAYLSGLQRLGVSAPPVPAVK